MKKIAGISLLVYSLIIAAAMISCTNSVPAPAEDNIATDIVKAEYTNDYAGLLELLNSFAGLEKLSPGEEAIFSIMGVNIGRITVNDYTDENNFSYEATFVKGSHSGLATVTIGNDINVDYEIRNGAISFSADMNGGSRLDVILGNSCIISADLPWNCSIDSTGMTVSDKSYIPDEAKAYQGFSAAFDAVIAEISKESGIAPLTLEDAKEDQYSYSFIRTEGSEAEWVDASYEGSITTTSDGTVYDISFTIKASDEEWQYSSLTIDGENIGASTVDKINTPYIINNLAGIFS